MYLKQTSFSVVQELDSDKRNDCCLCFLAECSLIDSDVDGLTDITVSSVHTSDLSSFEEDTEEEVVMSDSMEEGEITSDGEAFCLFANSH